MSLTFTSHRPRIVFGRIRSSALNSCSLVLRLSLACSVLTAHHHALAGNFAECIISKMPGTSNAAATRAVVQSCGNDHPLRYSGVLRGEGRGIFGYKSGNACMIKEGKSTTFPMAAGAIALACRCLYDEPEFRGQTCAQTVEGQ